MVEITAEEIQDWLQSKGTQWFFEQVKAERDHVVEQLVTGATLVEGQTETLTGRAVGTVDALDYILKKDFIDG